MKKLSLCSQIFFMLLSLSSCNIGPSRSEKELVAPHPCIYVSNNDHELILNKIQYNEWARIAFDSIKHAIDIYADRHQSDPSWIVSRLSMYWKDGERFTQCYLKNENWDRGEGNAPVPTLRMPGMRVWNKYANVALENRIPYNETGDMLGIDRFDPTAAPVLVPYKESGHMIRNNNAEILSLAETAGFLYWVTGEEKYAQFASDIYNTWLLGTYYMNPILDPERSSGGEGGWEPGGICGYYDYEQIHDEQGKHAAVIYDFIYDYLAEHHYSHIDSIGKNVYDMSEEVMKRFIDLGFVRGGKSGNWNVNGWDMMLHPIMALRPNNQYEDGHGREYYLHYLLEETTDYHEAIPDILSSYNQQTGMWPEAPGYAFGVVRMLLDWQAKLKNLGIDLIEENPILQKASLAFLPWTDDRGNLVLMGDTRGGMVNPDAFERMIAYYQSKGDDINSQKYANALSTLLEHGQYNRSNASWQDICQYAAIIPQADASQTERMAYSPDHRAVIMKNSNQEFPMMAVLYGGTSGSHLTPNGLAIQLFGYGYALAPDAAAYESYWADDYSYHQAATGSNTILPGSLDGDIEILAMDPAVDTCDLINQTVTCPYVNLATFKSVEKERTLAMIRINDTCGYYLDIYSADLDQCDYLFHNVGDQLTIKQGTNGSDLPFQARAQIEPQFQKGYKWFHNAYSCRYGDDFYALWQMPENITSRLWLAGEDSREIITVEAPSTNLYPYVTPGGTSTEMAPTHTLIIRQHKNASKNPFIAVYEPFKAQSPAINHICRIKSEQYQALQIDCIDNIEDVLFKADGQCSQTIRQDIQSDGKFGVVRLRNESPTLAYLGYGTILTLPSCQIKTSRPAYASLYKRQGEWYYSSSTDVEITIGHQIYSLTSGYNQPVINGK